MAVMLIEAAGVTSLTEGTVAYSVASIPLPLSFAASLIYAHGLLFHAFPRLNPPAWSLEIEFQFYVIAPALILMSFAVGRWCRSFVAEVCTMAGLVFAMKFAVRMFAPADLQQFLVSNFVDYFVLGFVLSRLYARGLFASPALVKWATPLFLSGIVLALVADHIGNVNELSDSPGVRAALLVAFVAIFAGALSGGVGRRFTSATWVATIGGMCYTIYLIHLMLFQMAARVLLRFVPVHDLLSGIIVYGLLLTPVLLVSSVAFFLLIEKPCMDPQWPQKLFRRMQRFFRPDPAEARR